jgi:hypothetical protein
VDRVKTRLVLQDLDQKLSFMNLCVSNFWGRCVWTCISESFVCTGGMESLSIFVYCSLL